MAFSLKFGNKEVLKIGVLYSFEKLLKIKLYLFLKLDLNFLTK
jgi:hypothetical protein